jgi:4'-phosphopantetheinyl transferase
LRYIVPMDLLAVPANWVDIWYADLNVTSAELNGLEKMLARDERVRASRFHFRRDRVHFVAARGILRQVLARYVDRDPRDLRFGYNSCGKPFLQQNSSTSDLRFNLSHSHGMAMYGIAHNREIGVDLERIDPTFAGQEIAERFFSRWECSALRTLPTGQQAEGFFNCWTRKEAYIKANGTGLHMRLDSFTVPLTSDQQPELSNGRYGNWSMHAPRLLPGYAAAVVVQGTGCTLETWEWNAAAMTQKRNASI